MFINILFLILGTVAGLCCGFSLGLNRAIPLPSYRNSNVCDSLPKDQTITSLIHMLGAPIGAENGYVLFTASPTGNPIKAKIENSSGKVLELICN